MYTGPPSHLFSPSEISCELLFTIASWFYFAGVFLAENMPAVPYADLYLFFPVLYHHFVFSVFPSTLSSPVMLFKKKLQENNTHHIMCLRTFIKILAFLHVLCVTDTFQTSKILVRLYFQTLVVSVLC